MGLHLDQTGRNVPRVRLHNRHAVLRALRRHGPLSRRQLACQTGLQPGTISGLTADLLAEGLLRESAAGEAPARAPRGRPERPLHIAGEAVCVLGVHIGVSELVLSVGDALGRVLDVRVAPHPPGWDVDKTLRAVVDLSRKLAGDRPARTAWRGVGVTVGGVVDPRQGTVRALPERRWRNVAVRDRLATALGLPTVVDDSRRAMLVAEVGFGAAREVHNALLVHVASIVGGAILAEQRLVYGASFGSAQLGHLTVQPDGPRCACGGRGCLNLYAAEPALVDRARGMGLLPPSAAEIGADDPRSAAWRLLELAAAGDAVAGEVVATGARVLGEALKQVLVMTDPEIVLVAGAAAQLGELYLAPLRGAVLPHLERVFGRAPAIVASGLGQRATAGGSVALALECFVYGGALVDPEMVTGVG